MGQCWLLRTSNLPIGRAVAWTCRGPGRRVSGKSTLSDLVHLARTREDRPRAVSCIPHLYGLRARFCAARTRAPRKGRSRESSHETPCSGTGANPTRCQAHACHRSWAAEGPDQQRTGDLRHAPNLVAITRIRRRANAYEFWGAGSLTVLQLQSKLTSTHLSTHRHFKSVAPSPRLPTRARHRGYVGHTAYSRVCSYLMHPLIALGALTAMRVACACGAVPRAATAAAALLQCRRQCKQTRCRCGTAEGGTTNP